MILLLKSLWKICNGVPVETDSLHVVKKPWKSPGKVLERLSNLYEP